MAVLVEMDLGVADVHVDASPTKRQPMSKYTCDDSLDSKDACTKAMKRCMDAQASKADDDDDEAFDNAKKKIEAAMKLFDDGGDPTAMDDDGGDSTAMSFEGGQMVMGEVIPLVASI